MSNLPEQAHGTAVATVPGPVEAYQIDQSMVKLPSLYLIQYSSKAFKGRRAGFGDIVVGVGAEDPEPSVLVQGNDDGLSKPVRFYVHTVAPGYQIVDEAAPYGKRSLRLGTTFPQALRESGGDPTKVFLQTHYTLTIPEYELWPVRFIMGSRWGGNAGRWINTQVSMLLQQGKRPLDSAFQLQTKSDHNDSGDFVSAVVGFAKVPAKQAAADQEVVMKHVELLSSGAVDTSYEGDETGPAPTEAPSLA